MNHIVRAAVAAALVFAATGATPAVDGSSPTAIVRSLYQTAISHHEFERKPYLTPRLDSMFAWSDAIEKCTHKVVMDWDPYSGTQVAMTSFTLGSSRSTGTASAEVPVNLVMWKGGHARVLAETVKTANGWRIDDLRNAGPDGKTFSVYQELTRQRASIESPKNTKFTSAQRACVKKNS